MVKEFISQLPPDKLSPFAKHPYRVREDAAMDNLRYVYPDLKAHGVEVEVHTFAGVPHGMAGDKVFTGRVDYPNFELWIPLADAFMQDVYKKL